jgi:hypothetical protein
MVSYLGSLDADCPAEALLRGVKAQRECRCFTVLARGKCTIGEIAAPAPDRRVETMSRKQIANVLCVFAAGLAVLAIVTAWLIQTLCPYYSNSWDFILWVGRTL